MSEEKNIPKVKMTKNHWMAIFFCGMGMTAFDIQYLARNFYVIYQEAFGTTDAQMGLLLSAIGVAATIAYFYGGIICDVVKPRTMLTFAYSLCTIASLILLTNPGFVPSIIIFVSFALTPLWAPMVKFLAVITPEEASGKTYGWLDSFNGITELVIGFVGSWVVASFGSALSVRLIISIHAAMSLISLIGLQIISHNNKAALLERSQSANKEESFNFKNLILLMRDPSQWLVWLGIAFGYTGYIGLTYLSPMLVEFFGVSTAAVTALDTIRNNGITFILPIVAGWLSDKIGAVRSYFLWLGFYVLSMGIILIIPWTPVFYIVGIASVLLLACSVKGRSPLSSSMLTQVRTPMYLFSTAVGMESLLLTLPDTFCYTIAGNLIESKGQVGYYYVFAGCLVFALLGLICNIILDRRMKAGKTSEAFFAKHQLATKK